MLATTLPGLPLRAQVDPDSSLVDDPSTVADSSLARVEADAAYAQSMAELFLHVGHLTTSFSGTPSGRGILPAAMAEADIALEHARLAAADSVSVVMIRTHVGHVIQVLDPSGSSGAGPGLGYGVAVGANAAVLHIGLAVAAVDSVSPNVALHLPRVAPSLANAVRWTDEAIALARQVQLATSVQAATPLAQRLVALCNSIRYGRDSNRNGIVEWIEGEGGLAQASYHLSSLQRGEGLQPPR